MRLNVQQYMPCSLIFLTIAAALCVLPSASSRVYADEITLPSKEFADLDTFEAVAVEDADKLFAKKDYRGAYAAYKAYSFEFARGRALPYVLLRMGRCLHLSEKRNTAIKAYQDVVDYFPNEVRYAAAALFYIGQCHMQNGNEDKALAAWAKLAKDKGYVQQPLSGRALVQLSEAMAKRGEPAEATRYRWRTAVAFAKSNPNAARDAREQVVDYYTVQAPNQAKLLEFCKEVGGFGWRQTIDEPENSPVYWSHVLNEVLRARLEDEQRANVAQYWDSQMGDRFKDNDALRVRWFNLRLLHNRDMDAWLKRMDEQFRLEPVTVGRVKQWLGFYNRYPTAQLAFFETHGKPLLESLGNQEKLDFAQHLHHPLRMDDAAGTVVRAIRTDGMDDEQLRTFANFAVRYEGEEAFLRVVGRMDDKALAARTRFDFYHRNGSRNGEFQDKALAEVSLLSQSPDHADAIVWPHAELQRWKGNYEEAIKLYRQANREPQSTWEIIDCRVALKEFAKAVELCKQLESVGGNVAARACLRAADIHRIAGDRAKEVQQLQLVLRRYPKSGESSDAHNRLESYGVKLIGGEATAQD